MTLKSETRHFYTIEFDNGELYLGGKHFDLLEEAGSVVAHYADIHIVEHYDNVIHHGIEDTRRMGIDS